MRVIISDSRILEIFKAGRLSPFIGPTVADRIKNIDTPNCMNDLHCTKRRTPPERATKANRLTESCRLVFPYLLLSSAESIADHSDALEQAACNSLHISAKLFSADISLQHRVFKLSSERLALRPSCAEVKDIPDVANH